jgi:hypothetical protein
LWPLLEMVINEGVCTIIYDGDADFILNFNGVEWTARGPVRSGFGSRQAGPGPDLKVRFEEIGEPGPGPGFGSVSVRTGFDCHPSHPDLVIHTSVR